jgi:FtsZ-interacting cell division protein ZipA
MTIPFWAKIVGPLALFAILFTVWQLDRRGQYNKGEEAGIEATDAKWIAASEKLKEDAARSATKADDAAAKRLDEHVEQIAVDQAAVDEAVKEGRSPLDALFN